MTVLTFFALVAQAHLRADDADLRAGKSLLESEARTGCDEPPLGFEVISCVDGAADMRPTPGDWVNGAVSAQEKDFIDKAQAFALKYNLKFLYDVGGAQALHPGHLAPLMHVLPGRYISLNSADPANGLSQAILPRDVVNAVEQVTPDQLTEYLEDGQHVVLSTTVSPLDSVSRAEPESRKRLGLNTNEFDWLGYRQIVYFPKNDGEQQFWTYYFDMQRDTDAGEEDDTILRDILSAHVIPVAARPFQDMQFSRYWMRNRYAEPTDVIDSNKAAMKTVHAHAACTQFQDGCSGVLLIVIPAGLERRKSDDNGGCELDMSALQKLAFTWKLAISLDPACSAPADAPLGVFINSQVTGASLHEMVDVADAIITFTSESLVTILGTRIDIPIVRVLPDIDKYYLVLNRVFNASMGRVIPKVDDRIGEAVGQAVQQMREHGDEVVRARTGYAQRYWWRIDGYEEYRSALQLLALSAPNASAADLAGLAASLRTFSAIPPRPPALYGYSYPPSRMFFSANSRNEMVWSAVKKAFWSNTLQE